VSYRARRAGTHRRQPIDLTNHTGYKLPMATSRLQRCVPAFPFAAQGSVFRPRVVNFVNFAGACVGLALLPGGCALTPPYARPPAPIPAAYPAPGVPAASVPAATADVPALGYTTAFGDPRLIALIDRALAYNRDLAASVARVAEARAQFRIVRAAQLPAFGGNAATTAARTSGVARGGSTAATDYRYATVQLGVTAFELDFWGRVRALSAAARARYLATEQARRAYQLSLIQQTATAWFSSRSLAERLALAQRAIASRREAVRIAKLRLDAGVTSALDYTQTLVLLQQAQTEAAILERSRAQADNLLLTLTGGPAPGTPQPEPLPIFAPAQIADVAPGLPSALLANRPDIAAAEETLIAANASIGAARAAFFPQISLTAAAGFASGSLAGLFGANGFTYTVGPSATLPIFDFGRTRANLAFARATAAEASATYQRTIQTAFEEVADALAGRRWLAEQLAAQESALAAQRTRARLANLRYKNGVAGYLEVLDAERDLFAAEQAVVDVRGQQLANAAQLYVALGGGAVR